MTKEPLVIHANGASTLSRPAERGVLSFTVSSTGPSKVAVSADVTACGNELQMLFRSLNARDSATGNPTADAAVTWWTMKSISTRTSLLRPEPHQERHYTVITSFEVKFKDFVRLSSIASDLSTRTFVTIKGVQWQLTDATKAALATENRRKAVRNAMGKARDIAAEIRGEGAVLQAVEVTDIDSPSTPTGFTSMRAKVAQHMSPGQTAAADGDVLNLQPDDVDLRASVKVKFVVN